MFWGQSNDQPTLSVNATVVKKMMQDDMDFTTFTDQEVEAICVKMEAWLANALKVDERYLSLLHAYMVCKV